MSCDERGERRGLRASASTERIGEDDRRADVAERLVDRVRDGVDGGRLPIADDHHALALRREQILHGRREELVGRFVAERRHRAALDAGENRARGRASPGWRVSGRR